ncbi:MULTISPECIES: PDDEXK nuclease domain-containing protein [unclassified Flavobacterium]|jgi:predicted nuclease of restriction endonuclease-like (RecB) superfamily|uniref:PDDEXK nuclease domain-containing protein n=1 Tax=unclassified Flavobacterium TaxID=196869 RepID=UPI0025BC3702|nr:MULTISPECIES: PDDEXK nuclease domain-containing protein [unclassified Flavobacterium]
MINFDTLAQSIQQTHTVLQQESVKAINISLTVRNWLIGFYIIEFEQNGKDRATYGNKLLANLSKTIAIKGLTSPELSRCRQFYTTYPFYSDIIHQKYTHLIAENILRLPTAKLENQENRILGLVTQEFQNDDKNILGLPTPKFHNNNLELLEYNKKAIQRISYTHFVELIKIKDPTQRQFYELLILKTQPSVAQLKKQIHSLAFERVGLSQNTALGFDELLQKIEPSSPIDSIKSHYIFDFLKLGNYNLIEENTLEQALINHLQEFIVELGNGFCFEARQKKILIDEEYYFVDLVFYHRILKCHILIELKADQFKHEHLSQLNTYVSYYREEVKQPDDNPPIGILLGTQKGTKLVEYALSGMDEKLFVSKYLLQLPSKEVLQAFIENELKRLE